MTRDCGFFVHILKIDANTLNFVERICMQRAALIAVLIVFGLACKKQERSTPSLTQTPAPQATSQESEAALASVKKCVANAKENTAYWTDAINASENMGGSKVEAACAVNIMNVRHILSLLNECHELLEKAKSLGPLTEGLIAVNEDISNGIKGYKTLLAPESQTMTICKKWSEQLLAKPIEGPPKTSIPDGHCPTYGQILRDARNRYNSICVRLGDCSRRLQVTDRVADPYDKTRCDTSVKLGREPVFISALYRRSGDNWQLEEIN